MRRATACQQVSGDIRGGRCWLKTVGTHCGILSNYATARVGTQARFLSAAARNETDEKHPKRATRCRLAARSAP